MEPKSCSEIERWLHMAADGELAHEDQPEVDEHLASCPRCQAELGLLEKTRAGLARAGSEARAPDALIARIEAEARGARNRSRVGVLAAAIPAALAVAALAVGGLALYRTGGAAAPAAAARSAIEPLAEQVARVHGLEVPVDVASADPRRVARFLEQRIGHRLEVPKLDQFGLDLAGGRVISLSERPGAQIVYRGALGKRLSLIALPDPESRLGAERVLFDGRIRELPVRIFREGGTAWALAGDAAADLTESVISLRR